MPNILYSDDVKFVYVQAILKKPGFDEFPYFVPRIRYLFEFPEHMY